MQTSSEPTGDPWAVTTTESTGTRHSRASPALSGTTSTAPAQNTEPPSGAGTEGGPIAATIDRSAVTREDLELALQILQIVALLAAAYAAYE